MYRHTHLDFVVNQSIWFEGAARVADVLLPACTSLERWDFGETANCSGYIPHCNLQLNHRTIVLQHKCIEPLGESQSDFEIFRRLAERLGMGTYYSEGTSEYGWTRRLFYATDVPRYMSWRQFLKKGYFVVPPFKPEEPAPVSWNRFHDGRPQ